MAALSDEGVSGSPSRNGECSPGNSMKQAHVSHRQDRGCRPFPKAFEPGCLSAGSSASLEVEEVFGCPMRQCARLLHQGPVVSWVSCSQTVHSLVLVSCFRAIPKLSQALCPLPCLHCCHSCPWPSVSLDSASTFCPLFSPFLHPYLIANHQMPFGYSPQNILGLLYTLGLQTHVPGAIHSAWYSEYQQRVVEFMSLVGFFLHAVICMCVGGCCTCATVCAWSLSDH